MVKRDIIVIGASAGGFDALVKLVQYLDPRWPLFYFVVLHLFPGRFSYLPEILTRSGNIPAINPYDGIPIKPKIIYVAPPNKHMIISDRKVFLDGGPAENYSRPSINMLFRSAAANFGSRVIGVILSGLLDDGTSGLTAIKENGGIAIAQEDPLYPEMVTNALKHVQVDYCVPLIEVPRVIYNLYGRGNNLSM